MFRRSYCIAAIAMLLLPAVSQAQFKQGDWELTLGGNGSTPGRLDGFSFGASGSLGLFVADQLEVGVRQSVNYTDLSGVDGKAINGSTRVFADLHLDLGAVQPFVGANGGFVYGDGVHDTWELAPEAGVKVFVNGTTFLYGLVEYQIFLDNSSADNAIKDGQLVYTIGVGFRF
jgi:hypothetical protein